MPRRNDDTPRPKRTLADLMEAIDRRGVRTVGDRLLVDAWTRKDGSGAKKRLSEMAADPGMPGYVRHIAGALTQWRLR